jgi:hypothetical protein
VGLGLIDIDPDLEGLIIMGRDSDTDESTTATRRRLAKANRVQIETYDWLLSEARERLRRDITDWERRQTESSAAGAVISWLGFAAAPDSSYFANMDLYEPPKNPVGTWTTDIPQKFTDFINEVNEILAAETDSRIRPVAYDKTNDYVLLAATDDISWSQAQKIAPIGHYLSVNYLLTAIIYVEGPGSSRRPLWGKRRA